MRIIIQEEQYKKLMKQFINEDDNLNEYGLTDDEMRQVEKISEDEAIEGLKQLKKNIEEKQKDVDRIKDFDFSQMGDQQTVDLLMKDYVEPLKKELERLKKGLKEFNHDEYKKRYMNWHLHSAGGLGYSFRHKRYRDEALNRKLTKDDIIDLFVTALEGGSNYWYYVDIPKNIKSFGDTKSEAIGEYILQGNKVNFYDYEERLEVMKRYNKGEYNIQGDVVNQKEFNEDLEETYLGYVDMNKILETITIIKKDYPEVWENILLEQADAGDADVFLQLCVMGEIVYG